MALAEQIGRYFDEARHSVELSYQELEALNFDTGFRSRREDSLERRTLTHPIVTTAQRFSADSLEVVTFSGINPVLLRFPIDEPEYAVQDYVEVRYVLEGKHYIDLDGSVECFVAGEVCLTSSLTPTREVPGRSRCTVLNVCLERGLLDESFLGEVALTPLQSYLRASVMLQSNRSPFVRLSPTKSSASVTNAADQEFARLHPEQVDDLSLLESELSFLFGEAHYRFLGYELIQRGHALRLMDRLSTLYHLDREQLVSKEYEDALFASVDRFMHENIDCVSLDLLSREFGYHQNYFNELIKRHTGATYSSYLVRLRISRAQELLARSNLPVDQVCLLVGYSNRGFFYRKFTEECGVTPAQWRKKARGRL